MANWEIVLDLNPKSDWLLVASSNLFLISPAEPVAFIVSRPFNVSTRTLCLDIFVFIPAKLNFARKGCTNKPRNKTIGTQIKVYDGLNYYYIQHQPTRGFQSSVDLRPHIGLPTKNNVDIEVTWTNGLKSNFDNIEINQIISISQSDVDYSESNNKTKISSKALFERLNSDINFSHAENIFIDFNKNRLLPHMLSTPGPKIINGDINGDGLDEIFVPGSKDTRSTLLNWKNKSLIQDESFTLINETESETIEPLFFDADSDGDLDLYTANGGIEFSKFIPYLSDKLYFNDGSGNFTQSKLELPTNSNFFNSSTVEASDIDKDGDMDLFVGERLISDSYGVPGSGVILLNNGKGCCSLNSVLNSKAESQPWSTIFPSWFKYSHAFCDDLGRNGVIITDKLRHKFKNVTNEASHASRSSLTCFHGAASFNSIFPACDNSIIAWSARLNLHASSASATLWWTSDILSLSAGIVDSLELNPSGKFLWAKEITLCIKFPKLPINSLLILVT